MVLLTLECLVNEDIKACCDDLETIDLPPWAAMAPSGLKSLLIELVMCSYYKRKIVAFEYTFDRIFFLFFFFFCFQSEGSLGSQF